MKFFRPGTVRDLIAAGIISLLLIPVVIFSSGVLRIVLGLPFVIFLPGYSLVSALFPERDTITGIERIAYSLALSFALVALSGLLLNYIWEISVFPMLLVLEIETFLSLAIAWYRRHILPETRSFVFSINWRFPWQGEGNLDRALYVLLGVAIIGAVIVSVYTYNKNIQGITEFYLLGENGKAEGYPQELLVNQPGEVTLVLVNRERRTMTYRVMVRQESGEAWVNGEAVSDFSVSLDDGQEWRSDVTFAFDEPGGGQKLEFLLFTEESSEPYLSTYLKVNIES